MERVKIRDGRLGRSLVFSFARLPCCLSHERGRMETSSSRVSKKEKTRAEPEYRCGEMLSAGNSPVTLHDIFVCSDASEERLA